MPRGSQGVAPKLGTLSPCGRLLLENETHALACWPSKLLPVFPPGALLQKGHASRTATISNVRGFTMMIWSPTRK